MDIINDDKNQDTIIKNHRCLKFNIPFNLYTINEELLSLDGPILLDLKSPILFYYIHFFLHSIHILKISFHLFHSSDIICLLLTFLNRLYFHHHYILFIF